MKQGKCTQYIVLKLTKIGTTEFIKNCCCSGFLRRFLLLLFVFYNRTIFCCEENFTLTVSAILATFCEGLLPIVSVCLAYLYV